MTTPNTLPSLPEPSVPEGDWFERDCYIKEYATAYGQQCRAQALNEALLACKHLETAIDGGGNTYYRPADARQCVAAIEKLKD